jgi:hypothetical protein
MVSTTRHDWLRSGSSWSVTARISSRFPLVMATSSSTLATSMARTVGSGTGLILRCPAPGCSHSTLKTLVIEALERIIEETETEEDKARKKTR